MSHINWIQYQNNVKNQKYWKKHDQKSDFFHLVLNFHWYFESKFIETLNQTFQLIPNQQANNLSYKAPENPKLL